MCEELTRVKLELECLQPHGDRLVVADARGGHLRTHEELEEWWRAVPLPQLLLAPVRSEQYGKDCIRQHIVNLKNELRGEIWEEWALTYGRNGFE